jgi:hypothetical protein
MAQNEATKYRRKIETMLCDEFGALEGKVSDELLDKLARMVPPLYGTAEAAAKLDVDVSNLGPSGRRAPKDLPAAVVRLRSTRLWLASDIDEFAKRFKRERQGPMDQRKAKVNA